MVKQNVSEQAPDILPKDQAVRDAVLHTGQSFIVQAPAGSGKTELLMRRFLALLAQVQRPEEILALTFTRKAAAEMRERVLKALQAAAENQPLEKPQDAVPRRLAKAALAQDAKKNWQLLKNTSRLRIETIDAFSASLVQQLPILSKMGSESRINDHPDYAAVVARAMQAFTQAQPEATQTILTFWKNDPENLQDTLVNLLQKRDQWRRFLAQALRQASDAESFCNSLAYDRQALRAHLLALLPKALLDDLHQDFPVPACDAEPADWDAWVLHFLTKDKDGEWRKSKKLADSIAKFSHYGIDSATLKKLRHLPTAKLPTELCALLYALLQLLQWADAELVSYFATRGECDFSEVAAAAVRALSDPEDADVPSDILLKLDQRLSHLLVDEFQDTSYSQYQLLEKLLSGWQPEDGRTLFLVGDPMQSIYGFREAEVSLFIKIFAEKVFATRDLQACSLSENFRSRPSLVQWYNAVFQNIFPAHSNPDSDAVAFRQATVTTRHDSAENKPVLWHFCDADQELSVLIQLLQQELADLQREAVANNDQAANNANQGNEKNEKNEKNERNEKGNKGNEKNKKSIAVLFRTRTQIKHILAKWPSAAPAFHGLELQALAERPAVRDVQAFCAAWLEPTDMLSSLAVCHSPLVGFTLHDLQQLQAVASASPFCFQESRAVALTPEKRQRFQNLCQQYAEAQLQRQRRPVVAWLEAAWLAAGGLAALADDQTRSEVLRFWQVLRERFGQAVELSQEAIAEALAGLFADTQSDSEVQFMTIHKAKGLEFDRVILLGLNQSLQGKNDPLLLYWQQWFLGDKPLFLLTANSTEHPDALLELLKDKEKAKQAQEKLRLLYVAVTRAKSRLHLLVPQSSGSGKSLFIKNSFLEHLLPELFAQPFLQTEKDKRAKKAQLTPAEGETVLADTQKQRGQAADYEHYYWWPRDSAISYTSALETRHLPFDWRPPEFSALPLTQGQDLQEISAVPEELLDESDSLLPRQLGRVIHRFFWRMVQEGLGKWPTDRLASEGARMRWWLRQEGVLAADLAAAQQQVQQALENTLNDTDGRWLLQHSGEAEWALSFREAAQVRNFIIDRTFVAEGKRFIVDYKTSQPKANESLDDFFAREKKHYQEQLTQYAKILRHLDAEAGKMLPITLALYFPLVVKTPRLCTWDYSFDFIDGERPL